MPKAAAGLGDGDGQQRFARFADFGALGDEAKAVEVHVGTAGDRNQRFSLQLVLLCVLLQTRNAQGTGGLENAARVLEHILDGRASCIGVDQYVVVDPLASQPKRLAADQFDRGAVRKQPDVVQLDAFAGLDRAHHGVGVAGLHADDLDLRPHGLDIGSHPGDQAAAADRDEDRVDRPLVLAQDLHRHRALAGNHVGIVERMDEAQAALFLQLEGMAVGIGEAFAVQDHGARQVP